MGQKIINFEKYTNTLNKCPQICRQVLFVHVFLFSIHVSFFIIEKIKTKEERIRILKRNNYCYHNIQNQLTQLYCCFFSLFVFANRPLLKQYDTQCAKAKIVGITTKICPAISINTTLGLFQSIMEYKYLNKKKIKIYII